MGGCGQAQRMHRTLDAVSAISRHFSGGRPCILPYTHSPFIHKKALPVQRFLLGHTHHIAGLSLKSLRFCFSSFDMGRFSGVLRGGIGDMNQRW